MEFEVETGVDLGEVMSTEPDRSALREFAREFELRAIMERLEEGLPEGEVVPGRRVEREIEVEPVEGSPSDIVRRPRSGSRSREENGPARTGSA